MSHPDRAPRINRRVLYDHLFSETAASMTRRDVISAMSLVRQSYRDKWTISKLGQALEDRSYILPLSDGGISRLSAFVGHYGENTERWDKILDMWDRRQKRRDSDSL